MDLFYIHSEIGAELNNIGNEMVAYSYPYEEVSSSASTSSIAEMALRVGWTETYVKSRLSDLSVYEKVSTVTSLLSDFDKNDSIDIVVTYLVEPYIPIPGFNKVILTNHFFSKRFIGYGKRDVDSEERVYITRTGYAYHTHLECQALKVTPSAVYLDEVENERNIDGSKYYGCEWCSSNCGDIVYITPYGNRYHSSENCGQLRIDIFEVPISEVEGRSKCRFCE